MRVRSWQIVALCGISHVAAAQELGYATYVGGTRAEGERIFDVAADPEGNLVAAGKIGTSPVVIKLDARGRLIWFRELEAGHFGAATGVAVDRAGTVFVTGLAGLGGFVAKLTPRGDLEWLTHVTGVEAVPTDIAVDGRGMAFIAGMARGGGVPTTPGAFQPDFAGGHEDAFVLAVEPDGGGLFYASYLGGSEMDTGATNKVSVDVDARGNAYVSSGTFSPDFPVTRGAAKTEGDGSEDVFVSVFDPSGSTLVWSTRVGGPEFDRGFGLAVDADGSALVSGFSQRLEDLGFDALVARVAAGGGAIEWERRFAGDDTSIALAVEIAADGTLLVAGVTRASDFPVTADAWDGTHEVNERDPANSADAFWMRLDSAGGILHATYFGGEAVDAANGIADGGEDRVWIGGQTQSPDLPVSDDALDDAHTPPSDGFLALFADRVEPPGDEDGDGTDFDQDEGDLLDGEPTASGGCAVSPRPGPAPFLLLAFAFLLVVARRRL